MRKDRVGEIAPRERAMTIVIGTLGARSTAGDIDRYSGIYDPFDNSAAYGRIMKRFRAREIAQFP